MTSLLPAQPAGEPVLLTADGKPVRVLQLVATGTSGGAQQHVASLLEGLDHRRFEVRVISFSNGSSVTRWRAAGVPVEVVAGTDDEVIAAVGERIAAWQTQVVHAHMYRAEVIAARAASRVQAHGLPRPWVIGHVHSSRVRGPEDRAILRALDPSIDRLVAVSRAIEAKLRAERPLRPPVSLISNGVDVARFESLGAAPSPDALPRAPVVGCVARLEPEKGHETLLRAWAEVLRSLPSARLLIIGEGSRLEALRDLACALSLPPTQVIFSGYRDDIPELTRTFDVAVLPSYREAQGLAILEAMAAARPVVASRVGGIVEMVREGVTGLLVPPGDTVALSAALVRLLGDRDTAERFGRAGRQVARTSFGIGSMLSDISTLYEDGAAAWSRRADVDAVAGRSA